jgi:hypothetical protein
METLGGMITRTQTVNQVPAPSDASILELRPEGKEKAVASMMLHRGYLWLALPEAGRGDPTAMLTSQRNSEAAGLDAEAGYRAAISVREQVGAFHLYVSRDFILSQAVNRGVEQPSPQERQIQQEIAQGAAFFRMDVSMDSAGIRADAWLGLSGEEMQALARAFRARNRVPAFETFLVPRQHVVVKLSADLVGLWKTILDLAGQGAGWTEMLGGIDAMGKQAGVGLRKSILDNLGDSYLLALRVQPGAVMDIVAGRGRTLPALEKLLEAVLYLQVRDTDLLSRVLRGLEKLPPAASILRPLKGHENQWEVGDAATPLTLAVDKGIAVLATSPGLARDAVARLRNPGQALSDWPATMKRRDHQVVWMNVARIVEDLRQAQAPKNDPSAAFAKAMIEMTLGRLATLGEASLYAVLRDKVLAISLSMDLN